MDSTRAESCAARECGNTAGIGRSMGTGARGRSRSRARVWVQVLLPCVAAAMWLSPRGILGVQGADVGLAHGTAGRVGAHSSQKVGARAKLQTKNGPSGGSGRGFGRGPIGEYKCYQVCPPIVYPTGHDPYYDTAYYQYETELHGGPFGPGTLNPFNPNNPRNFAGHWPGVKRPVPTRSLPQTFPENYYPPTGMAFLQLASRASSGAALHANARAGVHPKGVMCLHVCPKQPVARPDDEPFGGPFGPDPYYFRGKMMFNNKNGHTGFSSSASRYRNYQNEAYGGPFGPDPYYIYGMHSKGQGLFGFPPMGQ